MLHKFFVRMDFKNKNYYRVKNFRLLPIVNLRSCVFKSFPFFLCCVIITLIINVGWLHKNINKATTVNINQIDYNADANCQTEKMKYSWTIHDKLTGTNHSMTGRKFDCNLVEFLQKFQISDNSPTTRNKAKLPGTPEGAVFVTAANEKFYPSLKALIGTIKKNFGKKQKIIFYDLGQITKNQVMMGELSQICNLDIRIFDFKQLPPDLRGLRTFSWKIMILAQTYAEYETFIYCDTSVHFLNGVYNLHFDWINNNELSPFLFGMGTHHGIKHATLPETFEYLPLYTYGQNDLGMFEANMIIVHKSEFSRKILKWAVLCALTQGCIEPRKVPWDCDDAIYHTNEKYGLCHRMDQSVLSILVHNSEAELVSNGDKNLIIHNAYNHISHRYIHHELRRSQKTDEDIANMYKC